MKYLVSISSTDGFMPRDMRYLGQPGILALHVISDSLIALAYFSIPLSLVYFASLILARMRRGLAPWGARPSGCRVS
jgi:hypothetical protein